MYFHTLLAQLTFLGDAENMRIVDKFITAKRQHHIVYFHCSITEYGR